ncbi:MAG: hypothetical protein EPO26_15980 [Chloroflexota bacterium]|nr:MAG: hypothetical protein EPO26_15980 [Chloroflexota bacterium]
MSRALIAALAAMATIALGVVGLAFNRSAEAIAELPLLARVAGAPRVQGRLLFVSGGRVQEWSEGAVRVLTPAGTRYETPAFSPDGTRFAASEVGQNHSDLYLFDSATGQRLLSLTNHWSHVSISQSAWGRRPAWSPDGERILYVSDYGGTDMSLWSVSRRGGDNRRVWTLPLGSAGMDWPDWSPDARRIAYVGYASGLFAPSQVFALNPTSGTIEKLSDIKDGAFDPAWSPDGRYIAFTARVDGRTRIATMRADGSDARIVSDGKLDRAPIWSPDGTEIAYLASDGVQFDAWAVTFGANGVSDARRLTNGREIDAVSGLSWSR